MTLDEAAAIALIGLIAGMMGGLAGIGGSIIVLPALHLVFGDLGFGEPAGRPQIHHMYMAAAMATNVAVSLPAAYKHHQAGAVRVPMLRVLMPISTVAMVLGVLLSNQIDGRWLRLALAFFLMLYCAWNIRRIERPRRRKATGEGRVERATTGRLLACGGVTGLVGGLLGLGGGFLMVPMLQLLCNMRLKNSIATSSAVLCVTAALGAAVKMWTLPEHGESIAGAAMYALIMAPTGVLGALVGALWLQRLPVTGVRAILTLLIFAAATRLVG